jgi:hypothetical protein
MSVDSIAGSTDQDPSLEGTFRRATPGAWIVLVQVLAAGLQLPLLFLTSNWRANPPVVRILSVGLIVSVAALGLYGLGSSFLRDRWKSLEGTTALLFAFWYWNAFDAPSLVAATAFQTITKFMIPVLVVTFAVSVSYHHYLRVGLFAASVTMASVGVVILMVHVATTGESSITAAPGVVLETGADPPDIYILIVDGYARNDVLASDYDYSNSVFIDELESADFFVAKESKSNYSLTHYSIASILSMGYVADSGPDVSVADLRRLGEIIGGDNPFVSSLQGAGYRYVHGPSGWWGANCGPRVDECLAAPLIDMSVFDLLQQTPASYALFNRSGDPGVHVALDRYEDFKTGDWLTTAAEKPVLVFLHITIPHPPTYLDEDCEPRLGIEYSQRLLNNYPPYENPLLELRKDAYVKQLQCTNDVIRAFVESTPEDATVIVMSDHGPDSRSQIAILGELWDSESRKERFANLVAIRTPCNDEAGDDIVAVNVVRFVLNCLFDAGLPMLEGRYFTAPAALYEAPLIEVDDPDRVP